MINTSTLVERIQRLDYLDRQCIELSYEHVKPTDAIALREYLLDLFSLCDEAFTLWNEIRLGIAEVPSRNISDKNIRCILEKVRHDKHLYVIRQYKSLINILGGSESGEFEESLDDYLLNRFDELFDKFHISFDYVVFYRRKVQAGCIVVPFHNNPLIDKYYAEISDAFSFGMFRSSIALCRALLELVLYGELAKRKLLKKTNVLNIETDKQEDFNLARMINKASQLRLISNSSKSKAHRVRKRANDVLHQTSSIEETTTEENAFEVIRGTAAVVEDLLFDS